MTSRQFRIMIVDDDSNIAMALRLVIKSRYPDLAIDTALDGLEAWEKMEAKNYAYDLVLSDWNMPRMSGGKLLDRIRADERTKQIPFLMLTVRKDSDSVMKAIRTGVTDYVVKPFDKDILLQKIESLLSSKGPLHIDTESRDSDSEPASVDSGIVSARVMDLIEKGEVSLPTMPQIIFKVEEALRKETVTAQDMAALIELDAGLSSKLIGVANSVFYGGTSECAIVENAILRLGLEETRELVHVISNRSLYAAKDNRFEGLIEDLFIHSLACGMAAKSFAVHMKLTEPNSYFALGLLHDIGKLLLIQSLSVITKDMEEFHSNSLKDCIDSLHNKVGEMLLVKWGFPQIYSYVALNHQDISGISHPHHELAVVYLANLFVRRLGYSLKRVDDRDLMKEAETAGLPLSPHILDVVTGEVNDYVSQSRQML